MASRHINLVFISICIALVFPCLSFANSTAFPLKIYRNSVYGYELTYSPDIWSWYKKRGDSGIEFHKDATKGFDNVVSVYFHTWEEQNLSRDAFLRSAKKDPDVFLKDFTQAFPDAKLLDNGETFLGNFPAHFLKYSYTIRNLDINIPVTGYTVITIKGGYSYQVTFESFTATYSQHFEDFKILISTLAFR